MKTLQPKSYYHITSHYAVIDTQLECIMSEKWPFFGSNNLSNMQYSKELLIHKESLKESCLQKLEHPHENLKYCRICACKTRQNAQILAKSAF